MDQNVIRPVMPKRVKTSPSKALDQSSRGFWYFEHLNLACRAAQIQNLPQVDWFYHTFCSTSILSTFLFIGPYLWLWFEVAWNPPDPGEKNYTTLTAHHSKLLFVTCGTLWAMLFQEEHQSISAAWSAEGKDLFDIDLLWFVFLEWSGVDRSETCLSSSGKCSGKFVGSARPGTVAHSAWAWWLGVPRNQHRKIVVCLMRRVFPKARSLDQKLRKAHHRGSAVAS